MKHKRQNLSKDEDGDHKDLKGDDESQSDSNSKKSCQGCELPSDDIPDSTSNSRGHNNNTPSATNNNQNADCSTPNSTLDSNISTNNLNNVVSASNIISADSSVASSISLDDEDESPIKVKKKDEKNVIKKEAISTSNKNSPFNNNYDLYRRDSDGILVPMPSSGSGGTATPPTISNPPLKSKRINNPSSYQNIPEYFDGYFPQVKPSPGEYYGKYELEITPQSQRICGTQLIQNQNLPHHQPQPQQNHANYYNHNPHLEANCNTHYQAPFSVNYPNQQNEYEINTHQQQQNYGANYPNYPSQEYEMGSGAGQNYGYPNFQNDKLEMAHYESGDYPNYPNYHQNYPNYPSEEPTRPNPNFNFNNVPAVATASVSTVVPPIQQQQQQQPFPQPQPHNHIQQPHNSLVENSTDFNFLSNIANDFVPEYYQLS
ncbi:HOXA2 family protein [Megaselia abdita]